MFPLCPDQPLDVLWIFAELHGLASMVASVTGC
jgi:hypothetical protein